MGGQNVVFNATSNRFCVGKDEFVMKFFWSNFDEVEI
jgi:hypothetical protein